MTTQSNSRGTSRSNVGTMILLGASYPVVAHVAILSGRPDLIAGSIALLAVMVLFPGLRNGRRWAWALLFAAALGLYQAARSGQTLLLLFLPPILLNGFMAWVFGRTLRLGRTPLIERAIILLHGPAGDITDDIIAYARHLTRTWATLFGLLAIVNFVLAAIAKPGGLLLSAGLDPLVTVPLKAWSLFANVLNYVVVAAMFAVEYMMRLRRFPERAHGGFFNFIRRLSSVGSIFRPTTENLASRPGTGTREH